MSLTKEEQAELDRLEREAAAIKDPLAAEESRQKRVHQYMAQGLSRTEAEELSQLEQEEAQLRAMDMPGKSDSFKDQPIEATLGTAADGLMRVWDYGSGFLRLPVAAALNFQDITAEDAKQTLLGKAPGIHETAYQREHPLPAGPMGVGHGAAIALDILGNPKAAFKGIKGLMSLIPGSGAQAERQLMSGKWFNKDATIPAAKKTAEQMRRAEAAALDAAEKWRLKPSIVRGPVNAAKGLGKLAVSTIKGSPISDAMEHGGRKWYSSAFQGIDGAPVEGSVKRFSDYALDRGIWGGRRGVYLQTEAYMNQYLRKQLDKLEGEALKTGRRIYNENSTARAYELAKELSRSKIDSVKRLGDQLVSEFDDIRKAPFMSMDEAIPHMKQSKKIAEKGGHYEANSAESLEGTVRGVNATDTTHEIEDVLDDVRKGFGGTWRNTNREWGAVHEALPPLENQAKKANWKSDVVLKLTDLPAAGAALYMGENMQTAAGTIAALMLARSHAGRTGLGLLANRLGKYGVGDGAVRSVLLNERGKERSPWTLLGDEGERK